MTGLPPSLTAHQRAELEAWNNRVLTREEFDARVNAPWGAYEQESFDELVAWFNRRYPTVRERLASVRRLFAEVASGSRSR